MSGRESGRVSGRESGRVRGGCSCALRCAPHTWMELWLERLERDEGGGSEEGTGAKMPPSTDDWLPLGRDDCCAAPPPTNDCGGSDGVGAL